MDEPVRITVHSAIPQKTFIGIHLLAQDSNNINVGNWQTTDSLIQSQSCGGLMHKSEVERTSVEAVWYPSSNLADVVTIRAIIIENSNTIYIDCPNIALTPATDKEDNESNSTTASSNATAASSITTMTSSTNQTTSATTTTATTTTTTTTTISTNATTTMTTLTTSPTNETTNSTSSTTTELTTTTAISMNTTRTPSPTADVSIKVVWKFNSTTNVTSVSMTINNLQLLEWAAIGLGTQQAMGVAHVFMCKRLVDNTVVINRYKNPGEHDHPVPTDSEDGGVFTPIQQTYTDGVVSCAFTLSNFTTQFIHQPNSVPPLSQSSQYYPLFAVGFLNITDNSPRKHAKDSRTALAGLVQLNQDETILYKITPDTSDSLRFLRAHGIVMIFTWILVVSTGVLISRYFKLSWTSTFICGKAAWFASHRFLMSAAAILTTLGFLFILTFLQGAWVPKGPTRQYAHSITGIIVISLAFFQPFLALFRCEPDSRYRCIFNIVHAFVGFSSFILATATLFLATYFEIFKDNKGRLVMIIWTIWVAIIFTTFEIIQIYYRKIAGQSNYTDINASNSNIEEHVENSRHSATSLTSFSPQENPSQKRIKNVLLAIHILIAFIISIVITTNLQS